MVVVVVRPSLPCLVVAVVVNVVRPKHSMYCRVVVVDVVTSNLVEKCVVVVVVGKNGKLTTLISMLLSPAQSGQE